MIIPIDKNNKPKRKDKETNDKRKTVIHVMGAHNLWGLGDSIRGAIKLFQLSEKMNFNLVVDVSLHPISNFLEKRENKYSDFILAQKNKIDFINCDGHKDNLENYIKDNNKNVICLFTNSFCDDKLTGKCKLFMKNIFTPNEDFKRYIDEKKSQIPHKDYNILHYRLGDRELVENKRNKNIDINRLMNQIKKMKNRYILISDSNKLKNYVKQNTNIFMFDTSPVHTGYEKNINSIKNTIFEMFLIMGAKKIKTYSVYKKTFGTPSGFVYWISKIYDIPLEIIE